MERTSRRRVSRLLEQHTQASHECCWIRIARRNYSVADVDDLGIHRGFAERIFESAIEIRPTERHAVAQEFGCGSDVVRVGDLWFCRSPSSCYVGGDQLKTIVSSQRRQYRCDEFGLLFAFFVVHRNRSIAQQYDL